MVFSCAQHVRGPFCCCLLWHPYFVAAVRVCASLVWRCSHVMLCDGSVLVCVCARVCYVSQSRALVCRGIITSLERRACVHLWLGVASNVSVVFFNYKARLLVEVAVLCCWLGARRYLNHVVLRPKKALIARMPQTGCLWQGHKYRGSHVVFAVLKLATAAICLVLHAFEVSCV